ncbi:protein of unknown function DUF1348 [Niastella koreensis GR20-10]|uniref:Uncharacterized protein n=1 Tax=Niastella koreensis (strain DSM 17620 / KACC 11465 / NBRC 106392 / GR20-10) TaxID=700598 RepID=G8TFU1_NIAKG|nr:hypothetical protein [Niastella koreensis]AEW00540.1 protein of unknown function DUF1348 [Niastella koreensis GR20-10]
MTQRHPLPPFTVETALQKVQMAEDAWKEFDENEPQPDNTSPKPVVIADECGDSLWDEVLQQESKSCSTAAKQPSSKD